MNDMNNIFDGSEAERTSKTAFYDLLMTREWVTIPMILAKCMGKPLDAYNGVKLSGITKKQEKNFHLKIRQNTKKIIDAIEDESPGSIESNGKPKGVAYRYIGQKKSPLEGMRNSITRFDLQRYWQFCQDSAGLMPTEWLEYFFKNTMDLLNIKERKGGQVMKSSVNRKLHNKELVPKLYELISKKKKIRFVYKPFEEEAAEHVIHPEFLHDFEGRWQVLGYEEGSMYDPVIFSLDRFIGDVEVVGNSDHIREDNFYERYFEHCIGSSHVESGPLRIRVRANNKKMYGYVKTKPIFYPFEETVPFGNHEDGEYGEFEYYVHPNDEFYGRIMRMGSGLEIVSPQCVRDEITIRFREAAKLYNRKIGSQQE